MSQLSLRTLPVKVPSVVVDEEVDDPEAAVDVEAVPTVISESLAEVVVAHPTVADSLAVLHLTVVVLAVDLADLPLVVLMAVVLLLMAAAPQLVATAVAAMATHPAAVVVNPGGKYTITTSFFGPVTHRHGKGVI